LQKRTEARAEKAIETKEEKATVKKSSGGSRSDSFMTTLGKSFVRTFMPMLAKLAQDFLKGKLKGGGFGGYGLLDGGDGAEARGGKAAKKKGKKKVDDEEPYVPFQTIPPERGILGGLKR